MLDHKCAFSYHFTTRSMRLPILIAILLFITFAEMQRCRYKHSQICMMVFILIRQISYQMYRTCFAFLLFLLLLLLLFLRSGYVFFILLIVYLLHHRTWREKISFQWTRVVVVVAVFASYPYCFLSFLLRFIYGQNHVSLFRFFDQIGLSQSTAFKCIAQKLAEKCSSSNVLRCL